MMFQRLWLKCSPSFACLVVFLSGCSGGSGVPTVYPVSGKVIIDGSPKPYVRVALIPASDTKAQPVATGMTDSDGEFRLTSFVETETKKDQTVIKKLDGVQPGDYLVSLSWLKPIQPRASEPEFGEELLPAKYQNPAQSGLPELKVTITETDNELGPFELKRK